MMQRDGYYHDLCPIGTPTNEICDEQSKKFNSIYNNAFYSSAAANGIFGLAVDAIGPKLTAGISSAVCSIYFLSFFLSFFLCVVICFILI